MLSRSQRLSTREFATTFESGRVLRHPLMQVRVCRRETEKNVVMRAAFVAPKKLGKATARNTLRRRVRERFRLLQPEYSSEILASYDLVWIIGDAAQGASTRELDDAVRSLLKRAAKSIEKPTSNSPENRPGGKNF